MSRKIRKDITVGSLEKKLGVAPGTIKNLDGSDARSDKKLATLQKEAEKVRKSKDIKAKKSISLNNRLNLTEDQKSASIRKVKRNPKATVGMARKVQAAIKNISK
jgi:hypothetical protein